MKIGAKIPKATADVMDVATKPSFGENEND